jgi:hypothetical protein
MEHHWRLKNQKNWLYTVRSIYIISMNRNHQVVVAITALFGVVGVGSSVCDTGLATVGLGTGSMVELVIEIKMELMVGAVGEESVGQGGWTLTSVGMEGEGETTDGLGTTCWVDGLGGLPTTPGFEPVCVDVKPGPYSPGIP